MLAASVSHLFSLVYDYYSSDSSSYCCCCVDGVPMPISWCIAAHAQQQLLLYLGSSSKKRKKTGGWRECWSKEEEEEKRRRYKIFIKTHQAPGWSIIPGAACNSRLLLLLSPVPFAGKWERHKKPRSSPLRKRKGRRRRKSLWSIPSSKRAAAVQFFLLFLSVWCVLRRPLFSLLPLLLLDSKFFSSTCSKGEDSTDTIIFYTQRTTFLPVKLTAAERISH